jgi:hypothetical protein
MILAYACCQRDALHSRAAVARQEYDAAAILMRPFLLNMQRAFSRLDEALRIDGHRTLPHACSRCDALQADTLQATKEYDAAVVRTQPLLLNMRHASFRFEEAARYAEGIRNNFVRRGLLRVAPFPTSVQSPSCPSEGSQPSQCLSEEECQPIPTVESAERRLTANEIWDSGKLSAIFSQLLSYHRFIHSNGAVGCYNTVP